MVNGDLEQFLDTGWWNQNATLFYHDHIYFLEGWFDEKHDMHFRPRRWKARNVDGRSFENVYDEKGDLVDYDDSLELVAPTEDELREMFLKTPMWDGRTFWEVEGELVWLEPPWSGPKVR